MKKIRRNAEKKIQQILKTATKVQVHTHKNNYEGEEVLLSDKEIKNTVKDIKEGYATIYQINSKSHQIKYAGKCFWELKAN
ncbi:hypothetical protein KM915_21160 [Cytobacillus oceanisediminis]|uniref:hypothetical protein n=1 Tax=Cytobacillus oceanisediminis TaxID=665099 RepID=UPI001C248FB0|nr:hypothetical protein [Cytobacillus oceanisediminis]MBU8732562.1 hypothetical protein [Cytobacillus oceanisediminis]